LADFKLTATATTEELQLRTSCKLDAYISQRPPLVGGLFLSKNHFFIINSTKRGEK
jgi:hypothetical protein